MAAKDATITEFHDYVKYVWTAVTENDVASAVGVNAQYQDRSVQIVGTFGGATVLFQQSADGTNYKTCTDPQGNAISKTSADMEQISEAAAFVKPSISGGTAQSLTITLMAAKRK